MGKRFVGSYSTGKDSTFAVYKAIEAGYDVQSLVITYNPKDEKAWFHGVDENVIRGLEEALGIPVHLIETDGSDYEAAFEKTLAEEKKKGAELCVFGDIDIENHLKWGMDRCENTGLEAIFPLWKRNREDVVRDFVESGFKTVITTINMDKMDEKYLGRVLDNELIEELRCENIDVCGENGEYHSLVVDGPLFRHPLEASFEKEYRGNYARLKAIVK